MRSLTSKSLFKSLLVLSLVLPILSHAQRTISGKVISSEAKQPVVGASVLVKGQQKGVSTNAEGEFLLNAFSR